MEPSERVRNEINKLLATHPSICKEQGKLVSYFRPGVGPYALRRIEVTVGTHYPMVAPRARVSPYDDIATDLLNYHIYSDGGICYMDEANWNPAIHNLPFVFSQSKQIVYQAIVQKPTPEFNFSLPSTDLLSALTRLQESLARYRGMTR